MVERFCRDVLAEHARLLGLGHKFRGRQIDRRQLMLLSISIQQCIFALAERHLVSSHRDVRNLARARLEHNEQPYILREEEGVEPTNNRAERGLHTGVQWRRICFGHRSAAAN